MKELNANTLQGHWLLQQTRRDEARQDPGIIWQMVVCFLLDRRAFLFYLQSDISFFILKSSTTSVTEQEISELFN